MPREKFYAITLFINNNYAKSNLLELILQMFNISLADLKRAFIDYLSIDFDTYVLQLGSTPETETVNVNQDETNYGQMQTQNDNFVHNNIKEILEYIDSKIYNITAKDTAIHFNLNPHQFGILFQHETNMSFKEYVLSVKRQISSNADTIIIDNVIDYINANLSTVTVEEIIQVFGVPLKYLNTIFCYYLETYIRDYIYYRKVLFASMLILSSNATDEQLTAVLGFGSAATFSFHFKREFNCTPREYRNLKNHNPEYHTFKGKKVLIIDMKQGK